MKSRLLVLFFLPLLLAACTDRVELKQVMTFRMAGDCLVYGPWEEPIPSHGAYEIKVLRASETATKGYLDIYGFQWDTQFSYKQDSIFFTTPEQIKDGDLLKQCFQAEGWICGEDMFIRYQSWNTSAEGTIICEVFGIKSE